MNAFPRRPPPVGTGPTVNLTEEQFRQLMIAALEDSPRAREIVRQAFLPAFPIQGGTMTQNYIVKFADGAGTLTDSIMVESGTKIGINTTTPSFSLDVNGNVLMVGTKTEVAGAGGTMRFRDDTGTQRWLFGIPGVAGSTDFQFYNYVTHFAPIYIQNGAASYSLYMNNNGNVGIGTASPAHKLDVNGDVRAASSNVIADGATSSLLVGGVTAKQSVGGGGPEKLSFQDLDKDRVCIANFKKIDSTNYEAYARLLIDMKGNHEWAGDNDVDQSVLLGWLSLGRLQCQGVAEGGLSIHAWKHSTLTAPIGTTDLSIPVADISQFANASYMVRCENELIRVSGVSGNNLTIQQQSDRGVAPSTAASHAAGTYITIITGDYKDEAHARIAQNFDGTGIEFSDGAIPWDVAISRPSPNQLNIGTNPASNPATASLGIEMAVPGTPGLTPTTGGSLPTGTYYYRITALDAAGGETAAGGENTVNVSGSNNAVTASWGVVVGAESYRVYRGTSSGAEDAYHTYKGTDYTYTDNGGGTSGRPPAATTAYMAKMSASAILFPRLTTAQRNALTAVNGMIIYNTDMNQFQGYVNGGWVAL